MTDKQSPPFFQAYPTLPESAGTQEIRRCLRDIIAVHEKNRREFNRLQEVYKRGRIVSPGRVPSSSSDVTADDLLYDESYKANGTEVYKLVEISGTLTWVRHSLTTSW